MPMEHVVEEDDRRMRILETRVRLVQRARITMKRGYLLLDQKKY